MARGIRREDRSCSISGCDRPFRALDYCNSHYQRHRKGLVVDARMKKFAPGEWGDAWVAKDGYEYAARTIGGKRERVLMHRRIMSAHLGRPLFPDEEVHHKNGVRHDNRISNFELWSTRQPKGQRVEDKIEWALEILGRYSPDNLTAHMETV